MPDYLHNHNDFDELLRVVGQEKGIAPYLVAKDYWIMHVLYGLKKKGFNFQLKGGTSLSKGYGLIHRFSEDIDMRIDPPPEREVKTGRNHDKPAQCESRKNFYDWLAANIKIDGIEEVTRDTTFDDAQYRNGGIRLDYSYSGKAIEGVKPGILLEVGFDKVTPNNPLNITSWAVAFAKEKKLSIEDNTALNVECYHPGYTFVEKLQTIVRKHNQQQAKAKLPENFIRHYYDVMCLLKDDAIQSFIGTEDYHKHKEYKFAGQLKGIDLSQCEAFLLRDKATKDLYQREYEKTKSLYYERQPPFGEILDCIRQNLYRL